MCLVMCRNLMIGWDFGGRDCTVISKLDQENKVLTVVAVLEASSGLTDTASASKSVKISKNSADSAFGVAQCVAECGPNPGGFSCD